MLAINVNGKEYKVKFGYRVLCETDLMDRLSKLSADKENASVQSLMKTVAELLLAGLQKKHRGEFGYETESEKKAALDKVYELMDDYEDEGTVENPHDCLTLLNDLQGELMAVGFLSRIQNLAAEQVAIRNDVEKIPQDHKPAGK